MSTLNQASSRSLSQGIKESGLEPHPRVLTLESVASGVQGARFKSGQSDTEKITRSTTLWTIMNVDPQIRAILEESGLSERRLARQLGIDSQASSALMTRTASGQPTHMHRDLAEALSAHLRDYTRGEQIDLPDVAVAILRSARDSSRGLVQTRTGSLDADSAIARIEREAIIEHARHEALSDESLLAEARSAGMDDDLRPMIEISEKEVWSKVADEAAQLDRVDQQRRATAESFRTTLAAGDMSRRPSGDVADTPARIKGSLSQRSSRSGRIGTVEEIARHPLIRELDDQRRAAVAALRASLTRVFKFELRTRINAAASARQSIIARYRATLAEAGPSGLHEDTQFPTPPREQLLDLLSRRTRGSIGVAGPRGCGKTTLVRWLVADPAAHARLRIAVAAPASYLPREFMLHLYQRVCEEVLARAKVSIDAGGTELETATDRFRSRAIFDLLPWLSCLLGAGLLAGYARSMSTPPEVRTFGAALVVASVLPLVFHAFVIRSRAGVALLRLLTFPTPAAVFCAGLVAGTVMLFSPIAVFDGTLGLRQAAGVALVGAAFTPFLVFRRAPLEIDAKPDAQAFHRLGFRQVAIAGFSTAQTAVALGGLCLILLPSTEAPIDGQVLVGSVLVAGGGAAWIMGRTWLAIAPREHDRRSDASHDEAVRRAIESRDRILYQRQSQSGWTGSAKAASAWIPVELSAGVSSSTTEARTPLGVPDIVEGIRWLVERAGPAIICIDELDKIETPERAREFLNEIKGVLADTPRCFFLLSMSEDAIASFERRGLPFRDVFDSTFDEVVRVPYLSLEQSTELLNGRVTSLAPTFIGLAHCLSGGLPRDLIRVVDRMFAVVPSLRSQDVDLSIDQVAWNLIHVEVTAKVDATTAAIRQVPLEPAVTTLLRELHKLVRCEHQDRSDRCLLLAEDWLASLRSQERLAEPVNDEERGSLRTLLRLSVELLGFLYYCRTLLQVFQVADQDALQRLIRATQGTGPATLNGLAFARQHFAVNPYLAWDEVSVFREATGLEASRIPSLVLWAREAPPNPRGSQPVGVDDTAVPDTRQLDADASASPVPEQARDRSASAHRSSSHG